MPAGNEMDHLHSYIIRRLHSKIISEIQKQKGNIRKETKMEHLCSVAVVLFNSSKLAKLREPLGHVLKCLSCSRNTVF